MPSDDPSDEELGAALLDQLRIEVGRPDLEYRRPPERLRGGAFSSVHALELVPVPDGWPASLVVRLLGPPAQVVLEAGLHAAASASGLRAPRVLLRAPHLAELDTGLIVMERVAGRPYLRGVEPGAFALDLPKLLAAWPRRLATVVAALGRVDVDAARDTLEGAGVSPELAGPDRHLHEVTAALAGEAGLIGVVDWLHDRRPPPPERLALVHGDLWPGNVFVEPDGACLIDWTRGGIGDPALDVGFAKVGFALMPEPFPPPPPVRQLVALAGRTTAREISSRSDHLVGGPDRVRYFEALRCAVELAGVVADRSAGDPQGWAHGVPALVRHLEGITGRPVPFT